MTTNNFTNILGLAIAQETFKDRSPCEVSLEEYKTLKVGTKIRSHYRSATMEGTIVSIVKKGSSAASTIYEIRPNRASKHKGEPATVHRHGDKITVIKEFTKKTKPANEELYISQELFAEVFLGSLFLLGFGLQGYNKWKEKQKNKKKYAEEKIANSKATLKQLNETLLNDKWLSKLQYGTGPVNVTGGEIFNINGKTPTNVIDAVNSTIKAFSSVDAMLASDYNAFSNKVLQVTKVLEDTWDSLDEKKYFSTKEKDPEFYTKISEQVDENLRKLQHPMIKQWGKLPDRSNTCGGILLSQDQKADQYASFRYKIGTPKTYSKITLPPLNKEQVMLVGSTIKNLIDFSARKQFDLFANCSKAINQFPMPQDGWPYEHVSGLDIEDVFPIFQDYDGPLYEIGALNEQMFDPVYSLQYTYEKIIGEMINGLIRWVEVSCNVKIMDNSESSSESFIDSIGLAIATETHRDHDLYTLDPFSRDLTREQKQKIVQECLINPEYFFSKVVRPSKQTYSGVSTEGLLTNSIIKMKDHFSKEKYKNYEAHFVRNVDQLKTVRTRLEGLKTIKSGDLPDVKVTENASKFLTGMFGVPKDAATITKTMTRQLELTKIINSSFIENLKKSIATTVDGLKLYLSDKEKGAALIYKGMELSVSPELKKYLTVKNFNGEFPLASEPFVRQFRLTTDIWKGIKQEKINAIGFYYPAFKDFDTVSKIKPLSLEESKKLLDLAGAVNKATEVISLKSTFNSLDDVFYNKIRETQTELKKYEKDDGSYDRSIDSTYAFINSFYKEMRDFLFTFSNMNYIACSALMNIVNTNLNRYK